VPVYRALRIGTVVNAGASAGVVFLDSSSKLAQDATNFLWNDTNDTLTVAGASDNLRLVVKANGTQTANLQEWQNSTGTPLAYFNGKCSLKIKGQAAEFPIEVFDSTGATSIFSVANTTGDCLSAGTFSTATGFRATAYGVYMGVLNAQRFTFNNTSPSIVANSSGNTTDVVFGVRGTAGQSGNLQEWQNSSGTALSYVTGAGLVSVNGASLTDAIASLPRALGVKAGTTEFGFVNNSAEGFFSATNGTITVFGAHVNSADGAVFGCYSAHPTTIRANSNANYIQVQTTNKTVVSYWTSGSAPVADGRLSVFAASSAVKGLTVQGAVSQSANLQEWQDSSGTPGARVTSAMAFSNPSQSSGSANEIFGAGAGAALTTGANNVIIGKDCGASYTTGNNSVLIGQGITYGTAGNGTEDVLLGQGITRNATAGQYGGIAIGRAITLSGTNPLVIGSGQTGGAGTIVIGVSNTVTGVAAQAYGKTNNVTHQACVFVGEEGTSDRVAEFRYVVRNNNTAWFAINAVDASTADRRQFLLGTSWADSTDATRKARVKFFAGDSSGDGPECMRFEAGASSAALIGFLGATAVARQTGSAITGLVNLGLFSSSGYNGYRVASKTATYTAANEEVILCDATGGAFTINLPAAASSAERVYCIKKTDSSANAVTVDGNASETIDGALTQSIAVQYSSITIVCDGTSWFIL
jgi:hypothetical protein